MLIYQSLTPSPFLRVFRAETLPIDDDDEGDEDEYRSVFPVFQGTPSDVGGEAKTETKASGVPPGDGEGKEQNNVHLCACE